MANSLIRLKIENTTAYRGRVLVPGEEIKVDAKVADKLVERGLATVVGEVADETEQEEPAEEEASVDDELAGMNLEELREYAAEAGIDLKGKTKKADILAAIREGM